MDVLMQRVREEVLSNPPLGYEPQEAVTRFFDIAKAEVDLSKQCTQEEVSEKMC